MALSEDELAALAWYWPRSGLRLTSFGSWNEVSAVLSTACLEEISVLSLFPAEESSVVFKMKDKVFVTEEERALSTTLLVSLEDLEDAVACKLRCPALEALSTVACVVLIISEDTEVPELC